MMKRKEENMWRIWREGNSDERKETNMLKEMERERKLWKRQWSEVGVKGHEKGKIKRTKGAERRTRGTTVVVSSNSEN